VDRDDDDAVGCFRDVAFGGHVSIMQLRFTARVLQMLLIKMGWEEWLADRLNDADRKRRRNAVMSRVDAEAHRVDGPQGAHRWDRDGWFHD